MVLMVLVLGIAMAIFFVVRSAAGSDRAAPSQEIGVGALDRWVAAGLVAPDQAAAIARFEADQRAMPVSGSPDGRPHERVGERRRASTVPLVAEALGYLGGILAAVGIVLVVAHYWDRFALAGQVAATGGAAALLTCLGAVAGRGADPALGRMRALVWAAASAAAASCAVVIVHGGLDRQDAAVLTLAGATAAGVHSGLLWRGRVQPVQQLIALAPLVAAVSAATAAVATDGWWGAAAWLAGAALVWTGLAQRGPTPTLTSAVGAMAAVIGAIAIASEWQSAGNLLLAATALSLAAGAFVPVEIPGASRVALGAIGALAATMSVPGTIAWYAQDAGAATGSVVWLCGAALVSLGLAHRVRHPLLAQALGAVAMLAGAGVTAAQVPDVAPALGLLTAVALLAVGARPGAVLESLAGALGLLVYVPWGVARWFPGESRAPILLVVSGLLIVAVAVLISRLGGRVQRELRDGRAATPPPPPSD